jgi:ribosomal protein S18 acetylase RimI-like enzyme
VPLDVGRIAESEVADAVGVLARGMRDNPLHLAAFGDDPGHRLHSLTGLFRMVISGQSEPLRAAEDGTVVGTCGLAEPGACVGVVVRAAGGQLPPIPGDPEEVRRVGEWLTAWGQRDPDEPHWHLGPIAADAGRQGQGIGSALMEAFCARVDDTGNAAYLETDKAENVRFYEKFGFATTGEAPVIGVPNWFMRRPPR